MLSEVPQWVSQAFIRSAIAVGATADTEALTRACAQLIDVWSQPNRAFHNARHLYDMLARVDTLAPEIQRPDYVRLAAWGHGIIFSTSDQAIYSRKGGEDEEDSAEAIGDFYREIGIPIEAISIIQSLIVGLRKRHDFGGRLACAGDPEQTSAFEALDMDRLALCDAHFGTLASEPQRYKKYLSGVRDEYEHVCDCDFYSARQKIVTTLLERKKIFLTPLASSWEQTARQNLSAELERIKAKLAQLSTEPCSETELSDQTAPPNVSEPPMDITAETVLAHGSNAGMTINADDSLVCASAALDSAAAQEQAINEDTANYALRENNQEPSCSSLEMFDEAYEPGARPRVLNEEEARAAQREEISRQTREKIEMRQREAIERRRAEEAAVQEPLTPRNSMETDPDY